MNNVLTYWVSYSLIRELTTRRKNEIYVQCFNRSKTIVDLYDNPELLSRLDITEQERDAIMKAKGELSNIAFGVEDMLDQGYKILPLDSEEYPKTLKGNLKMSVPTVLYAKGNISLLNEPSIAIIGSRNADEISLQFADNVARKAAEENKVVVSGFAKGVDLQALLSALKYDGKSVIVLPQGILTFASGFRQYYQPIAEGRVVVISEFAPKAGWSVGLAMARNQTIYGLADVIYVAQSDSKGGTWEGVTAGLKLGRSIFVRRGEANEKSANNLLIRMGAGAVDASGNVIDKENVEAQCGAADIVTAITEVLKHCPMSCKQILEKLALDTPEKNMRDILASIEEVEKYKEKGGVYYRLKGSSPASLFDDLDSRN